MFFPVNTAHKLDPSLPAGHPHITPKSYTDYTTRANNSKAARILKIMSRSGEMPMRAEGEVRYYKSMEDVTRDVLAYFKVKGWYK